MRYILLVALSPLAPFTVTLSASAAIPAAAAQAGSQAADAAAQKPLARADVDLILRQARSAIQQGQLDQAESLISRRRCSNSLLAVLYGPDTKLGAARTEPAHRSQRSGGNVRSSGQQSGCAGRRNRSIPGAQPGRAAKRCAAPNSGVQPASAELGADHNQATIAASATLDGSRPFNQQPANPFARTQANSGSQTASIEGQNIQPGGISADRPAATLSADAKNIPWPLPSGQTPPPLPTISSSHIAAGESMPQLSSNSLTGGSSQGLSGEPAKKQALAHLQAARAALQSGDIETAEKLNRAASAVGVPESQFLPDEDRPSLLAWDIARARPNGPGLQSAAANPAAGASRYEMPLGALRTSNPGSPRHLRKRRRPNPL